MAFPQELAIVIQKEMEKLDLKQVKIILQISIGTRVGKIGHLLIKK